MSDVAVTWAKAQACLDAEGRKDRNAKQVLVHLASYADANGEGWAAVPVLAMECDVSERTVQRGLRALEGMGLLTRSREMKKHLGRLYPVYKLPLEKGHASTVRRLIAERENEAWGDTCVTPRGELGVTLASPQDVADVTPRGDTGVTQIGNELLQGLKPLAGACAKRACEAWGRKAPERVAARRVEAAWLRALQDSGLDEAELLAAVLAAVERDPDFARGKAMNLDRWLNDGRYEAWLVEAGSEPSRAAGSAAGSAMADVVWGGPAEVAEIVAGAMGGPAAVASYLSRAGWDGEGKVVLAATRYAAGKLVEEVGAQLGRIGVRIEVARG